MPKKVEPIEINETDVIKLKKIVDGSMPCGDSVINRARALLLMSEGIRLKDIAKTLGMRENTITDLRRRYFDRGIDCLLDKPKSGRPLTYDPEELERTIDLLVQQHVEENIDIPSVKDLSKQLKAPEKIVRELLQKRNIVDERGPQYWRFTLSDGTAPKLTDMYGLYLSHNEQALVVKVWTLSKHIEIDIDLIADSTGMVKTKTKEVASKINALIDESGKADMAEALAVFADSGRNLKPGKKDTAISFLQDVLKDDLSNDGVEYHVFTCGVSMAENKRFILPNTYLHMFKSQEEWLSQLDIIIFNMYSDMHDYDIAAKVRNSMYSYLRTADSKTEAFQWIKILNEKKAEDSTGMKEISREDTQVALTPGTVIFTAGFVNDDHSFISVRVNANIPITQADFNTDSQQGYLNSFDEVERTIVSASRETSRLLSEKYLGEIGKKKQQSSV